MGPKKSRQEWSVKLELIWMLELMEVAGHSKKKIRQERSFDLLAWSQLLLVVLDFLLIFVHVGRPKNLKQGLKDLFYIVEQWLCIYQEHGKIREEGQVRERGLTQACVQQVVACRLGEACFCFLVVAGQGGETRGQEPYFIWLEVWASTLGIYGKTWRYGKGDKGIVVGRVVDFLIFAQKRSMAEWFKASCLGYLLILLIEDKTQTLGHSPTSPTRPRPLKISKLRQGERRKKEGKEKEERRKGEGRKGIKVQNQN